MSGSSSSTNDIKVKSDEMPAGAPAPAAPPASRNASVPALRTDAVAEQRGSPSPSAMSASTNFTSPRSPKGVVGALRPKQRERLIKLISFELKEVAGRRRRRRRRRRAFRQT